MSYTIAKLVLEIKNSRMTEYQLSLPILKFNALLAEKEVDKRLKCENLIGVGWKKIIEESIKLSEGLDSLRLNKTYARLYIEAAKSLTI